MRRMTSVTMPGILDRVAFRVTRAIFSIGEVVTDSVSSALVIYSGGRKSSKVFAGCLTERARIRAGSLRSTDEICMVSKSSLRVSLELACNSHSAARGSRLCHRFQNAICLSWNILVKLTRGIAESVLLRISIICNALYALWETVRILA